MAMGMFDALRGRRDAGAGGQEDRRPGQGEPAQDRGPTDPGSEKATDLSDRYASRRQARSPVRLRGEGQAGYRIDGVPGHTFLKCDTATGAVLSRRWSGRDPGLVGLEWAVNRAATSLAELTGPGSKRHRQDTTVPPEELHEVLQQAFERDSPSSRRETTSRRTGFPGEDPLVSVRYVRVPEEESDFEKNRSRLEAQGVIGPGETLAQVYERITLGLLEDRLVRDEPSAIEVVPEGASFEERSRLERRNDIAQSYNRASFRTSNAISDYRASDLSAGLSGPRAPVGKNGPAGPAQELSDLSATRGVSAAGLLDQVGKAEAPDQDRNAIGNPQF